MSWVLLIAAVAAHVGLSAGEAADLWAEAPQAFERLCERLRISPQEVRRPALPVVMAR